MSKKSGPKSKFTEEQEAHIASFYDDLWEKHNTSSTAEVTSWKKDRIKDIMGSPLFKGRLAGKDEDPSNGADFHGWSSRILKKFNGYIHSSMKGANTGDAFFKFSHLTGFGLFGMEQRRSILSAAQAATGTEARLLDRLETRQKEMWAALGAHQREDYEHRAKDIAPSVATQVILPNQIDFPRAAARALNGVCRGGLVGHMELLLLWAYREEGGDLRYGVVNGHAAENTPNMADETEDWETSFDARWMRFAEDVIPRGRVAAPDYTVIPRNPSGIPVFPSLPLRKLSFEDITQILERYLTELWDYGNSSNPPWSAIAENADKYYDTSRFHLPVKLQSPDAFSTAETLALAEHFLLNAAADAKDPFVFCSGTADRELTPTERASSGTPDEDVGKRKGAANTDDENPGPQKKRKKAQTPNDGAGAVASTASGSAARRQAPRGRRAPSIASVPPQGGAGLNHSAAKPTELPLPRRLQPKREKPEYKQQRPAPPSGTGRPGFDYVLENANGEFIGWV
ncbi:hypothetical protein B0H11DRAFT_2242584 [Mycena galericulata]|nr:hypothetical protein B0H11DRAFT_2242584 [Mycena galericulata]